MLPASKKETNYLEINNLVVLGSSLSILRWVYVNLNAYICIYIQHMGLHCHMHICIHTYIPIYIHTHLRTYIHTLSPLQTNGCTQFTPCPAVCTQLHQTNRSFPEKQSAWNWPPTLTLLRILKKTINISRWWFHFFYFHPYLGK